MILKEKTKIIFIHLIPFLFLFSAVKLNTEEASYEPAFKNCKKSDGFYLSEFGNQIECDYNYEPLRFKSKQFESELKIDKIKTEAFNKNSFVLKFKHATNGKLIEEKLLQKEILKVQNTNNNYDYEIFTRAIGKLKIDSKRLDRNGVYKCCLEYLNLNSNQSLCSYLKFDPFVYHSIENSPSDDEFFEESNKHQLFAVERVMAKTLSLYLTRRDILIIALIFILFAILLLLLSIRLNKARLTNLQKYQQSLVLSSDNSHIFAFRMPQITQTDELYNDLYVRYNLENNNVDSQLNYYEFPPAYDEWHKNSNNNNNNNRSTSHTSIQTS